MQQNLSFIQVDLLSLGMNQASLYKKYRELIDEADETSEILWMEFVIENKVAPQQRSSVLRLVTEIKDRDEAFEAIKEEVKSRIELFYEKR